MNAQVALVTSTIGRPDDLRRLLLSLSRLDDPSVIEFILVDQDPDGASSDVLHSEEWPFVNRALTSSRGLSRGRNTGLAHVRAPVVTFPDDDCWYRPDTVSNALSVLASMPGLAGVSGIQRTASGEPSMIRWPSRACEITTRNFYRCAISSTMFMRTDLVRGLGGFDETLGAGSAFGYGSGEESDLLLRTIEAGGRWRFEPDIAVLQDDPRGEIDDSFPEKMARYSQGFGRVFADHRLSRTRFTALLGRKMVAGVVRGASGHSALAQADFAFVRGALAGYRDPRRGR